MIVSCRECNGKVSTEAQTCPHCGAPLSQGDARTAAPEAKPQDASPVRSRRTRRAVAPKKSSGLGAALAIGCGVLFVLLLIPGLVFVLIFGGLGLLHSSSESDEVKELRDLVENSPGVEVTPGEHEYKITGRLSMDSRLYYIWSLSHGRLLLSPNSDATQDRTPWLKERLGRTVTLICEVHGEVATSWRLPNEPPKPKQTAAAPPAPEPKPAAPPKPEVKAAPEPPKFERGAHDWAKKQTAELYVFSLHPQLKWEYQTLANAQRVRAIVDDDAKWLPYVIDGLLIDDERAAYTAYRALHEICEKRGLSSKEARFENPIRLANFHSARVRGGEYVFWSEWWQHPENQAAIRKWTGSSTGKDPAPAAARKEFAPPTPRAGLERLIDHARKAALSQDLEATLDATEQYGRLFQGGEPAGQTSTDLLTLVRYLGSASSKSLARTESVLAILDRRGVPPRHQRPLLLQAIMFNSELRSWVDLPVGPDRWAWPSNRVSNPVRSVFSENSINLDGRMEGVVFSYDGPGRSGRATLKGTKGFRVTLYPREVPRDFEAVVFLNLHDGNRRFVAVRIFTDKIQINRQDTPRGLMAVALRKPLHPGARRTFAFTYSDTHLYVQEDREPILRANVALAEDFTVGVMLRRGSARFEKLQYLD